MSPHHLRVLLGTMLTLCAITAIAPELRSRGNDPLPRWIGAPLDWTLRVPLPSVLLRWERSPMAPGERLVGAKVSPEHRLVNVSTRGELEAAIGQRSGTVEVAIGRGERTVEVRSALLKRPRRDLPREQWPVLFAGVVCLFFGVLALGGGRHPATSPLFAVSLCLGVGLLSLLDLVLPGDRGLLGIPSLRSRAGAIAWTILPATLLHLAMRFPALAERFRKPSLELTPYAVLGTLAIFVQVRFENAVLAGSVEQVSLAASYVAGWVLVLSSLSRMRTLTPIERHRTAALVAGLSLGLVAPLLLLSSSGGIPPPFVSALMVLSVLALPLCLAWAVARYRLLDPPRWLRSLLAAGVSAMVATLFATAIFAVGFRLLSMPPRWPTGEIGIAAVAAVLLYQGLHSGLKGFLERRAPTSLVAEEAIAAAMATLAAATSPAETGRRLAELLRANLPAAAVEVVDLGSYEAAEPSELSLAAIDAWQRRERPSTGVIELATRAEDPSAARPEAVIPVATADGVEMLVVASSRVDGLAYSSEEIRLLRVLSQLAGVASRAAFTAADLERSVAERTKSLARASADRHQVLHAAQDIFLADDSSAVLQAVNRFLGRAYDQVTWRPHRPEGLSALARTFEFEGAPDGPRWVSAEGIEPGRAQELDAALDTVVTFARLALSRLAMVRSLKLEVSAQSTQLESLEERRHFAELVRNVAHELRKPTEGIRRVACAMESDSLKARAQIDEIIATSGEMNRRLSLLMWHSGIHFNMRRVDLVRIIDDAVNRIRTTIPGRRYDVAHDMSGLPLVGDASRLVSLVENLVDNAAKATRVGDVIAVRSGIAPSSTADPGLRVWVEVRDEGVGIRLHQMSTVFEPGVSYSQGGFGLGLALCRQIAERHGGSVCATSDRGVTIFRVELPQWAG